MIYYCVSFYMDSHNCTNSSLIEQAFYLVTFVNFYGNVKEFSYCLLPLVMKMSLPRVVMN